MPIARFEMPDGRVARFEVPEGTTPEQAQAMIRRSMSAPKQAEKYDPTSEMSGVQTTLAGIGKGFVDLGRGVGQRLGLVDQKTIDEARLTDEALMNTTGGKVGNFVAQAIPAAATMVIPGAQTYGGAALTGAAMGLLQPTATGESAVKNALLGGGMGVAGQAVGQLIGKGIRASKAAAEPLYEKGQDAILGRLLNKAAGGPVQMSGEIVPGSLPTVGQAANNAGLASLERAAMAAVPEVTNQATARYAAQDAARRELLGRFADPAKREFFDASRQQAAQDLYKQAFAQTPVDSPWIKGQFTELMKRPAFQDALKQSQTIAANEGLKLDPKNQTQLAHYTKLALDDMIGGAQGNAQRALIDTRNKLLTVLESDKFAPAYGEARKTFQAMSKPVNEIDVAAAIEGAATNKLTGALQPAAYARALSDTTAQRATGFKKATLQNSLSDDALKALTSIKDDLARAEFAKTAGRGVGSDTVNKLAYSNFIDAAGVPTFLQNLSSLQVGGNILGRGADLLYGNANKQMAERLAQTMLNPQEAARIMALPQAQQTKALELALKRAGGLLGVMSPAIAQPTGLLAYSEQ